MAPKSLVSRACTAVVLVAVLSAKPVRAQEAGSPESGGRVLNGHVFMPATDVPPPFATTSFESAMILGYGTTSASFQVLDAQVLSGTLEYAGIGGLLSYEYAFLDHFSVRVSLNEAIYSGITGKSAIVVGSTLQGGGSAGFTASLPLGNSARVGFLFDAAFQPNLALTIGSAINSVIETCKQGECVVGTGEAFQQRNLVTYQPALAASWAPLPALGLTANVAYVWGQETGNNSNNNSGQEVVLGAAADFDFGAVWHVPVGLQAQFRWAAPNGSFLQHVTDLGGGIFYTGRKELSVGIQVVNRQFAVTPDVDVSWSTYLSQIGLRYYW